MSAPITPPAVALEAILCLVEEGLEASSCILDPATVSWTRAVGVILELRQKFLEAKAVVAESRVVLPPGPLTSAALAVIRDDLRRELDAVPDGWTETVSEQPLPPELARMMKTILSRPPAGLPAE